MRSVTILLVSRDGFQRTADVSEATFRYGVLRVKGPSPAEPREFVQDRSHLTLFRER